MKKILVVSVVSLILGFTNCSEKKVTEPAAQIVDTVLAMPIVENQTTMSDQILTMGSTAYVLQQSYRAEGSSWFFDSVGALVPVNVSSYAVSTPIRLLYPNPGTAIYRNGFIYVCTRGSLYSKDNGALEKVDPVTGVSTALIMENEIDSAFSTGIMEVMFKNDSIVYCQYYDGTNYVAKIAVVNILRKSVLKRFTFDSDGGVVYDSVNNKLFVGSRDRSAPGIYIVSTLNDSVVLGPVATGLPPYTLALVSEQNKLLITLSDYSAGKVKMLDCLNNTLSTASLDVFQDCAAKVAGGRLFILERGNASNIIEINSAFSVLMQKHLLNNSNPVDVAIVSTGKLMISLNNLNKIMFIGM